jgi:hypothetical protein
MQSRKVLARTLALSVMGGLVALSAPATAGAAATIGATFTPDGTSTCGGGNVTALQATSLADAYVVPSNGVITSWSHLAGATPPAQLKLKLARSQGGNDFTIIGESEFRTLAPSALNEFSTRITARAGDVLGLIASASGQCAATTTAADNLAVLTGDAAPGTTSTYSPFSSNRLDIAATLEPDADNDGFGDETQDACPLDETAHMVPCPAPDTTITAGPMAKTKKKRATFTFTASVAGASFQCSLDGAAFAACTSPVTVTVKKGKHSFAVRSTAKGQTDQSPANFNWKVKKKKKKK